MNEVGQLLGKLEQAVETFGQRGGTDAPGSEKRQRGRDGLHDKPTDDVHAGEVGRDLVVAAIVDIARHHGLPAQATGLARGLPLTDGRLALAHAEAAAARAGLSLVATSGGLEGLNDVDLPVVLPLHNGGLALVWRIERGRFGRLIAADCSEPGRPEARVSVPFTALKRAVTGEVIHLRPISGLDERGAEALSAPPRRWFLPAFRSSAGIYGEAILATAVLNVLALALPLFTMNVYDRVLPNAVEETLWALAIGVALATIFDLVIKVLRARFVDIASRRADVVLANYIFGRLLGARLPDKPVSAGVRANAMREFETLREFFNSATLTAFGDVPFLVVFLIAIFIVAGPIGWITVASIPIVLAAAYITQRSLSRLTEASFREQAQKNAVLVETVVGLETLKAANAESWAASKWEAAVAEQIRTGGAIRDASTLGQSVVFALQTLTQIVMIVAGFYLVAAGSITMGALIAATMLAGRALQPLAQVAMLIARMHQVKLAKRALDDIVNAAQERPDDRKLIAPAGFAGSIAFEAVGFTYDKDVPASLTDIAFSVAPGEKIALIGSIGSGKTTILKLIQALHRPTRGRVLIDGIPVDQIDPAVLRASVGLALQSGDLFHGTIRSNIALADPGAGDAEVLAAARRVGALEWMLRAPLGLDTPIRERGAGLSGGQRQHVTLARALFGDPRIVLLDEPTSDMDGRTEHAVVEALRQSCRDRTLIAVSHRPAVLAIVDRLIVLEAGRIVLDGPKAEVLKKLEALTRERAARAVAGAAR